MYIIQAVFWFGCDLFLTMVIFLGSDIRHGLESRIPFLKPAQDHSYARFGSRVQTADLHEYKACSLFCNV